MATQEHEECRGCASFDPKIGLVITGLTCSLKPIYKDKQCPCITCLVKMICMSDDEECKTYHDFGEIQFKDGVV